MPAAPIPFTPPHSSLNRVRVVDLPGVHLDEEVPGKLAYHLLSVLAMAGYARERGDDLRLPEIFFRDGPETRSWLPHFISASLESDDPGVRGAAHAVVRRMGRNLGHVLLTLHRGDPVNRAARTDWTGADWERWARIERVWLAGGLMSGQLGEAILGGACEWLGEVGYTESLDVRISPYAGATALAGAVRYLPTDAGRALCLDFGQTSAKRAILQVDGHRVSQFTLLPAAGLFGNWPLPAEPDPQRMGMQYRDFIVGTVCETLARAREQGRPSGPDIMLCVAAYVDGGRLLSNGTYATMMELTSDVRTMLGEAVAERTGQACRVQLIHDGTAAAAAFAGQRNTAVIALGTALGVGFAPPSTGRLLNIDAIPPFGNL